MKTARKKLAPSKNESAFLDALGARALPAIAFTTFAVFVVILGICALSSTSYEWNARRLVRAFAFVRGLSVYYPLGGGPLISGFNGPTQILAYLPTTLARTPSAATSFGVLLSVLWFYVPAFFAVRAVAKENRLATWLGFSAFGLACLGSTSLTSSSILIHGDSPSLGLAFLACALLFKARDAAPSRGALAGIAACAVFAVSAKVTVLPLVVALPLYVWFRHGRRPAIELLAWQAGVGALVLGLYLAVFGPGMISVNFVTPVQIPWVSSLTRADAPLADTFSAKVRVLFAAAVELSRQAETWIALFGFAVLLLARRSSAEAIGRRAFWLPLGLAVVLVPPSLLGRVKLGGGMNTLSPALAFVALALIVVLTEAAAEKAGKLERLWLGALLIVFAINRAPLAVTYASIWNSETHNLHDEAYTFSRRHPGTAYFPEYPLSGLMAEGRVYHSVANISEYGRNLASLKEEDFRRHVPAHVETIALRDRNFVSFVKGYLSDFTEGEPNAELPGWIILRKVPNRTLKLNE